MVFASSSQSIASSSFMPILGFGLSSTSGSSSDSSCARSRLTATMSRGSTTAKILSRSRSPSSSEAAKRIFLTTSIAVSTPSSSWSAHMLSSCFVMKSSRTLMRMS